MKVASDIAKLSAELRNVQIAKKRYRIHSFTTANNFIQTSNFEFLFFSGISMQA
jgi:hypothetical protein